MKDNATGNQTGAYYNAGGFSFQTDVCHLRLCETLCGITDDQLRALFDHAEKRQFDADQILARQGEKAGFFDILLEGRLEVFVTVEEGGELLLGRVNPGETVGEMGYFSGGERSASVRTVLPSRILRVHYENLPALFDRVPGLAQAFLRLMARRLRDTNFSYLETFNRRFSAERSLRHLNQFLDLSEEVMLGQGIEGLISRIVNMACRVMGSDRASLFLVDPTSGDLWSKVAVGQETKTIVVARGTGIAGWVLAHNEILHVPDAYQDSRFNRANDERTGYRTRNMLCGPVINLQGQTVGVIQVINKLKGDFVPEDFMLFKALSHQAAIAVETANLYFRLMTSHKKMAILLDVANSLASSLDLADLIRIIIAKTTEILECERASFFIFDREQSELWSVEAQGVETKEIRVPAAVGVVGYAALHNEIVNVPEAYQDARFNPEVDRQTNFRTRNLLAVPVNNRKGEVIGVAEAINKRQGAFDNDDVELFRAIASQISIALENAQLHTETRDIKNYLEQVQESLTDCLITLDGSMSVVTANQSACRLIAGDDARQLPIQGNSFTQLLGKGDQPLLQLLQRVYEKRVDQAEYDLGVIVENRYYSMDVKAMPLLDAKENLKGAVLLLDDKTGEKSLKQYLTRYLSKEVVEQMLADPTRQKLGGVRTRATIIFADIRDFTPMAESMSAEDTMNFLNQLFGPMIRQVYQGKGFVDKMIGDALMAVFGVPFVSPDDTHRAVQTALNMLACLRDYNRSRFQAGLPGIRMGVGLNTGEVISGNLGSEIRMSYTVIGDAVNLAARVESLTKIYGLSPLITEFTRHDVQEQFATILIDHVRVKGKTKPVSLYHVLGPAGSPLSPEWELFRCGLAAYQSRQFDQALDYFKKGPGQEKLFATFLERCVTYQRHPPDSHWDGVWTSV